MATSRPGFWGSGVSQDEGISALVPSRSWANGDGRSVDMYLSSQWPAVGHLGCFWFLNITHATEDISSHMFVPSCTCVWKISSLKRNCQVKMVHVFQIFIAIANCPAKVCQHPPPCVRASISLCPWQSWRLLSTLAFVI